MPQFNSILGVKRILVSTQRKISIFVIKLGFTQHLNTIKHQRLGTAYGGWWVPERFLRQGIDLKKLLISAGLGHDVSFEREMLKLGFEVIGLDPLPECITYARKQLSNFENLTLINKGLWTSDGSVDFYSPPNKNSDAYSITNSHFNKNSEISRFEVISLEQLQVEKILTKFSDFQLVMLKLDIEGAEIEILSNYLSGVGKKMDYFAVEIDSVSLIPFWKFRQRFTAIRSARKFMNQLSNHGYVLSFTEDYNFHWILTSSLNKMDQRPIN